MAPPKTARVVHAETVGVATRLVELVTDEPLGFIGGQYIIIDSGQILPNGKAAKRAYSILSSDADQTRIQLAVMQIPDGRCSTFVHQLEPGAEVRFSGPWGKLYPPPDAPGRTVVLATDTGISAALGLVRSARLAPLLGDTVLIWLRTSAAYFVPDAFVRDRVPAACGEVRIADIPPIDHPERIPHARSVLAGVLEHGPLAHGFISGDGAVNYALLDELVAAGVPATRDHVESFFNMPKKSAATAVST